MNPKVITDPADIKGTDRAEIHHEDGDQYFGTVDHVTPENGGFRLHFTSGCSFTVNAVDHLPQEYGWSLVSATRELPEVLPGTAGTATVRGEPLQTVMRCQSGGGDFWTTPSPVSGARQHTDHLVTDFVPRADHHKDLAEGLVDRDPADYGDAPEDAPADSTVCLRCGRVALHHSAGRYSPFGVCPVAQLPSRDQLAGAMHDDHLPTGHPRLSYIQRLILADAVGELLRKGGA